MASIQVLAPGHEVQSYRPGDFILTHRKVLASRLIEIGQHLRYKESLYNHWSHCALIMNESGDLMEALTAGVTRTNLSRYKDVEYHIVRIDADERDRDQAVAFALHCEGESYDWLTIGCIGASLLTGGRIVFGIDGHMICSGLVARSLERTGIIFERDAARMLPADLAHYFLSQESLHVV